MNNEVPGGDTPLAHARASVPWTLTHQVGAFALLLGIALLPLAWVSLPPLVDYPNHLARMHLLFETVAGDPVRQFYEPAWNALPNLAMEGVIPLLLPFMQLETAGRLFVALTLALLASGTVALHYAIHRTLSPWPLVAVLLLYNRILLWGFVNYLFALGLALWLLALWIHARPTAGRRQLLLFAIAGILLLYAHLFAFGVYAVSLATFEFANRSSSPFLRRVEPPVQWTLARASLPLLQLLPAVLLFLALSPTREATTLFEYGAPIRKVAGLASLFNNYDRDLDLLTFALLAALVLLALAFHRLQIHRTMMLTILALGAIFLAMPGTVLTSQGADTRFVIAIALVFIAASDLQLAKKRWQVAVTALLVAVFLARLSVLGQHWLAADAIYAQFRAGLKHLPPGSSLYSIDVHNGEWQPFPVPTAHLPCLAITDRSAFVPTLFAFATQQPLRFTPTYSARAAHTPTAVHHQGQPIPWFRITRDYSHVLLIDARNRIEVPPQYAPLWSEGRFHLYRTGPDAKGSNR